ncbi:ATP-binding protein [Pokkaliibacter sp. MBI-7]|uniref:sensor histidine kinase n=1 Tax=Pokkaliibacter sp. MBI-7 TaxID=3040600 RepID=UPI002449621E|nr:ATP-binding protein [Pokkaliibacter sp. MBI-7]MDH2433136.1 ATP-binding protein [Pokkaliibacter sp. MBI-7]
MRSIRHKLMLAVLSTTVIALYDAEGHLFARYINDTSQTEPPPGQPAATEVEIIHNHIHLFQQIHANGDPFGTVYINAELGLQQRAQQIILIVLVVTLLALLAAMVLSLWFQRRITQPMLAVTHQAQQVVEQHNYSLRAEKTTQDEIGYLVDAFNDMLSQIEQRTAELQQSNSQLAQEVNIRATTEAALRDSERRYRTLMTTLTTVIWRADRQGYFLPAQTSWDSYTGQTPDSHSGEGWLDAFHPKDKEKLRPLWQQACVEGLPMERNLRLWHVRSGEFRFVVFKAVPLLGPDGRPQEWMGVIDDVHERVQASQEVTRLNAELEQRVVQRTAELENANRELEAFSYSVSHDLRAPLRSIDGFSLALLEDYREQLDGTAQDYLDRVRAAAQRMGGLIDDLLNLARVSRMEIKRQPLNLSAMAEELISELQETAPERQVTVRIQAGLLAYGDDRLMRVALGNLLNNAWKYTSRCAAPSIEFDRNEEEFFIRDNGAGFDMTYASRLFTAFQRLHDTQEFPGTGVGLATVQRVIRRHGGQIRAEARINEGATFFFTLPNSKEVMHDD